MLGPCKPVEGETCPMGYVCCSDDPAVLNARKPNYYMDGVDNAEYGPALFSEEGNERSHWGYCIRTGDFASPLANGCPVPCNPSWDENTVGEICGTSSCCPFTAVDPDKDCIIDPSTQRWRTVRGQDIVAGLTAWGPAHATNQDPGLAGCEAVADGDEAVRVGCLKQLGVADTRGFCYSLECPCVEDVCDMKNPDWVSRCD